MRTWIAGGVIPVLLALAPRETSIEDATPVGGSRVPACFLPIDVCTLYPQTFFTDPPCGLYYVYLAWSALGCIGGVWG